MPAEELVRLQEAAQQRKPWKRWGPYLSERQWGTVREDYSADGNCWDYFSHDQARSRAYRWGEDGLLGISDEQCRLAFALALWNERDPILKDRLFGLTGPEGNHGEDVKELYYYLDSTPTHSYLKALYKYPQAAYPYGRLLEENRRRGKDEPEFELVDTGAFDDDRYFDVVVEYAKASPEDVLIRVTVANRGPETASIHVLPSLWFRNTWDWGRDGDNFPTKPSLSRTAPAEISAEHATLGAYHLAADLGPDETAPRLLFTENASNLTRLFGVPNLTPYVKDAFHALVIEGDEGAVNPDERGTKAAAWYHLAIGAGKQVALRLRLRAAAEAQSPPFGAEFDRTFAERIVEADRFHTALTPPAATPEERAVLRQARASLLWSKQLYYYDVPEWLAGDPAHPAPPAARRSGRNADWTHLNNFDVISMPDKWEYPWYAAWDLAFHMTALTLVDPDFGKEQLKLMVRERYMHPNGQMPAYEWNFVDVNPPVHAWPTIITYLIEPPTKGRDRLFLERVVHKLLLNFTWLVNRKDLEANNLFAGGFLALDSIGILNRSTRPTPSGTREQPHGPSGIGSWRF